MLIIQIVTILKHVWTCSNMSKLVQIQYDTNCYDSWYSQTCLNLFRFNMIRIDTILNYVKTWWNTLILSKWHKEVHWQSYSLDRFDKRAVKSKTTVRNIVESDMVFKKWLSRLYFYSCILFPYKCPHFRLSSGTEHWG